MPVFERRTAIPHSRSTVFTWFTRPGALVRLTPPFGGSVRQAPEQGIDIGATAVLGIGAPGSLGLGLGSASGFLTGMLPLNLPPWFAPEAPWRAEHTAYEEGRMFRDEMVSGPLKAWRHTHTFEDAAPGEADTGDGTPGCIMHDRVEYELPGGSMLAKLGSPARWTQRSFEAELDRQFGYRSRQVLGDLAFHAAHAERTGDAESAEHPARRLTVAITGASGLIGTQLTALLAGGGHRVLPLKRGGFGGEAVATGRALAYDPAGGRLDPQDLREVDVVVNLAGEPIGGRFTEKRKQQIRQSRTDGTRLIAESLAALADDGRQRALINASAVGYYGADAGAGLDGAGLDESLPPGEDFLAEVCRQWEEATDPARAAGVRTVMVRTGLVQTPAGGILQQMLPLFVLGLGGPVGTGGDADPWQSWIGLDDTVGIFAHAVLSQTLEGPVNGTAPAPVRATEFAATLGRVLRRPAAVPVPAVGPRLLLGSEGNELIADADQKARAAKVQASGYAFRHTDVEESLRHVLGRWSAGES